MPFLVSLIALALMITPAIAGAVPWRAGALDQLAEPNTPPDTDSTLMWSDANQAATDKIYFDAIIDREGFTGTPWVRPAGTNFRGYVTTYFHAFLGYWRDCNMDGFVGDATTGSAVYLYAGSDTTKVDSICNENDLVNGGALYNDGEFVTEYLPIGPEANSQDKGPAEQALRDNNVVDLRGGANFVRDDFAKVWHDWGTPGDVPAESRLLLPFPGGTLDDTNGHFRYVDNLLFGRFSENAEFGWAYPVSQTGQGKQCTPDSDDDGLTDDPVANAVQGLTTQSCSPIPNAPNPVTATVRDRYNDSRFTCTSDCGTVLVNPWDDDCNLQSNPSNWHVDTDGSVDPTWDSLYRSAVGDVQNSCGSTGASPNPGYRNLEMPYNAPGTTNKKAVVQTTFSFSRDSFFNPGSPDAEVCVASGSAVVIGHPVCTGAWYSDAAWLRDTQHPHASARPAAAMVASFFADINFGVPAQFADQPGRYSAPALLDDGPAALPGGSNPRAYGDHECNDGVSSDWSCDPADWVQAAEIDPNAANFDELVWLTPMVHDAYDLRDVECMDAEAAGTHLYEALHGASGGLVGDDRSCDDLPATYPLG